MVNIAIPVDDREEYVISAHFGHASFMAVYDSEKEKLRIVNIKNMSGCAPLISIKNESVDMIYCFGMGMRAIRLCVSRGIKLKTGSFRTVKEVIQNLDKLKDLKQGCGH